MDVSKKELDLAKKYFEENFVGFNMEKKYFNDFIEEKRFNSGFEFALKMIKKVSVKNNIDIFKLLEKEILEVNIKKEEEKNDTIEVPLIPEDALLLSMAIRKNHGFGLLETQELKDKEIERAKGFYSIIVSFGEIEKANKGFVSVMKKPSNLILNSLAIFYYNDIGSSFKDLTIEQQKNVSESMRSIYEEATGQGFFII